MPQNDSFISTNITIDDVSRALKDIASNQQLDDDIQTRRYEMKESFETPVIPMNRHERRAAKAKYNKLNKRRL